MSPKIQTLLILGCACISLTVMAADETTDRVERSMAVFAKGLDTLLLETPHVFIKQGDIVDTIYIPDVGVVFIGRISMTEGANVSILLNDWSNWFENISNHVDSSDQDQPAKPEEEPAKQKDKKMMSIKEKDAERVKNMGQHIAAFEKEMVVTVQDYGPVIKGLKPDEEIIVALMVKDKEFRAAYGTGNLIMRVKFQDLDGIKDKKADSPEVLQKVTFNIP